MGRITSNRADLLGTKRTLGFNPFLEALADAPTPRTRAESINTEEEIPKQYTPTSPLGYLLLLLLLLPLLFRLPLFLLPLFLFLLLLPLLLLLLLKITSG